MLNALPQSGLRVNQLKKKIPILLNAKRSVRLKVTGRCQWNCAFCHKEGSSQIDDLEWTARTVEGMKALCKKFGIAEVHLTGGEPTIHKNLPKVAQLLSQDGFVVKMTTNGQFHPSILKELIQAGLGSANFSVYSLNPVELAASQKLTSLSWAKRCIDRQVARMLEAKENGVKIKINTVVSTRADIDRILRIYKFSKQFGIHLRILNDLYADNRDVFRTISEIVFSLFNGTAKYLKTTRGSSSCCWHFEDHDGYEFSVKDIRKTFLNALCKDCRSDTCTETFYGLRLEQRQGYLFVRLCVDREDSNSHMEIADFLRSKHADELVKMYAPNNGLAKSFVTLDHLTKERIWTGKEKRKDY